MARSSKLTDTGVVSLRKLWAVGWSTSDLAARSETEAAKKLSLIDPCDCETITASRRSERTRKAALESGGRASIGGVPISAFEQPTFLRKEPEMDDVSVRARQTLASFLLAALIFLALPAMARAGSVVVSGDGRIFTTTTGATASFSVSVRSNTATGRTSGTVSFEPWGIVAAPVTCLDVRADDRVVIGGVAETNSIVLEPLIFLFYLVDGGTPGAGVDILGGESGPSRGSVADAAFCRAATLPFNLFQPIASGEVTIRVRGRTPPPGS